MSASEGSAEGAAEVHIVHVSDRQNVPLEEVTSSLELSKVDYTKERTKSLHARYCFGIIFLIMNLVAWFFRDYGQSVLPWIRYIKVCGNEGDDCFHSMGVLRVSLGCFIFFLVMFLSTVKTRKLCEGRNSWHSRWWEFKAVLLLLSMAVPFFIPSQFVQIYGEIARIGAGIFLLLQLVSVIHFIIWWNKYWTPDEETKKRCSFGLLVSTLFYIGAICGIVYMYRSYASRASCSLNIFFIAWTAILLAAILIISLNSKVHRGLLSSGIMASYIVFLCWCAIRSEPATIRCETNNQEKGNSGWITILGFLIAIFAIVLAAFSTGIDSKCFQFSKNQVENEDDIPYSYGFFHMVFSLGAMYFAMLFISWDLNNSARKWSIDVGWISTWVKVLNEWFAATIYIWMLISPIVRQNKVMDNDTTMQGRADSVDA
ncbi:putative serine incorporator/TMS membrane protein [Medicago truncatula]|uniref:Putative serine incorporator/TMS membrane protein n=1 Tax=Medicago truncatula TaxID=3880 RepID=A0A072VIB5_MEDTR|nr:probable serine incorporator [Medicago truncatula]KEH41193.1 TMS membrane protein/tumor differentially protein [Medicago truncatula]RHN78742.1 putative serine incorporator/TMS membrane protein [Medicago truncatula]